MIVFPNAKINLGLRILNKRDDGFHNLETVFYPVPWYDALECMASEKFSFQTAGIPLDHPRDNLCVKAFRSLNSSNAELFLLKNIPVGAGLGGGSADAAFTLQLLNSYFNLNLSQEFLLQKASSLGSDCSFFLQNKPVIATGKGDELTALELDLKNYFVTIIYPGIQIKTSWAYERWDQKKKKPDEGISIYEVIQRPIAEWKNFLRNDFEEMVFEAYPEIQEIKNSLYQKGARFASMSGSGSAIYGIFDEPAEISAVKNQIIFSAGLAI